MGGCPGAVPVPVPVPGAIPGGVLQRPYVCGHEGCGKGFTREFHRARHLLTHSGEKPFE